jgi:hypothetical protein
VAQAGIAKSTGSGSSMADCGSWQRHAGLAKLGTVS